MKRFRLISLLLAFSALLFPLVQIPVSPMVFELSHDDGEFDYGWSDFYPYGAMVKFTPPSAGYRLKSVRLHALCSLRGHSANFYVQIWDANLNTIYWSTFTFSQVFKDGALDWYTIELPNVVVAGEFYVVIVPMLTLDGPQLWISVDDDPPVSNTSFIVDIDKRAVFTSLDATSKKPGDFMIRVVGEPTAKPPEIKLNSIEVYADEIVLGFTYPRDMVEAYARLIRPNGSFVELNVTRTGSTLIVRAGEAGMISLNVVTPGFEVIGTSVKLDVNLWAFYDSLLANYTLLSSDFEEMSGRMSSLAEENESLRRQLNQSDALTRLLGSRVDELLEIMASLDEKLDSLEEEVSNLNSQNALLKAGFLASFFAAIILIIIEVRGKWMRRG